MKVRPSLLSVVTFIVLVAAIPSVASAEYRDGGRRDGGRDSRGTRVDVGFSYSNYDRGGSYYRADVHYGNGGYYRPVYRPVYVAPPVCAPAPVVITQPVYVQPAPVVIQQPVYVQPAPVVVQQPVYVQPGPVIYTPPGYQCNDRNYAFTSVQFRFRN